MTLPITLPNPAKADAAFNAVQAIVLTGYAIKSAADNYAAKMASANTLADDILSLLQKISNQIAQLTTLMGTPGLDIVARAEIKGYSGSLSADTQVVINAMQACVNWVMTNVPKDASGFVLVYKWNADGSVTVRSFTPAQMTGLIAAAQALSATIG